MEFPGLSVAKYSSVALASSCSGLGGCYLITHTDEEIGEVRYVQLTEEIKEEFTKELKESIKSQTAGCINKEKERLAPILHTNRWAYSGSRQDEKPKYNECIRDVALVDLFQSLYAKGKDQLLPSSVT